MLNFQRNTSSFLILYSLFLILVSSCSINKQIARSANEDVLSNKALTAAHVGISIFDPATNKYLYNYQGDKYFVPASNTKIPTCYAAMKYLGDSLVGLRYNDTIENHIVIQPTGDPTFLHPDFKKNKVQETLAGFKNIYINSKNFEAKPLGNGWSWNDYLETYMAERSAMPLYGNLINIRGKLSSLKITPRIGSSHWSFYIDSVNSDYPNGFFYRQMQANAFYIKGVKDKVYNITIPFHTQRLGEVEQLLRDTLKKNENKVQHISSAFSQIQQFVTTFPKKINSQPTDSLLKPMMHRSDNFFAEQTLLMVSNEMLGVMNDGKIIDTLLKTDFKDLPQKPRWADGSGLSRYNLFTPQDLVAILNKIKNEFGMDRIRVIFPTGGEGTISNYYKADSGYIYGKTGTLSGVVAFSGYLYTKKGKLMIFSTLINNHQASSTDVRRAVEKFLTGIRSKF